MASKYCVFIDVDDSHKDILQATYKVLNSWTVMEENPKENTAESGRETEYYKKIVTMATTSKVMMTTTKLW